jgi:hypothetical protein
LDDFDITDHLRETPRADAALLSNVIDSLGLYAQVRAPKKAKEEPIDAADNQGATSRNMATHRKAVIE